MIKAPMLQTELEVVKKFQNSEDQRYFDLQVEEMDIRDQIESPIELNGCLFKKVDFSKMDLARCTFIDCKFINCDFSNSQLHESLFRRVQMDHCNLLGTDLSKCVFQDFSLSQSQAKYANFAFSSFKDTSWTENQFEEGGFSECKFKKVEIICCNFRLCEFLHTPLDTLDFSDSEIEGIMVSGSELKGVIVNEFQAIALAKILGIVIK